MPLFKRKTYQRIYEAIISFSLVVSLFMATTSPQVVSASTREEVAGMAAILNIPVLVELNSTSIGFPMAQEREGIKTITVRATAYNSLPAQTDSTPCITANGFDLCAFYEENGFGNTVAANFLPLGTQVKFPELYGDKVFVVRDRMNARYGYGRIDIWMPERGEAKVFGAKRLVLKVF